MKRVTYAQMHRVLTSLGFTIRTVTVESKLRVYEHSQTGAMFWLAFRPEREAVLPHHMDAVQGVLKIHGIADPLDFAVELQNAS